MRPSSPLATLAIAGAAVTLFGCTPAETVTTTPASSSAPVVSASAPATTAAQASGSQSPTPASTAKPASPSSASASASAGVTPDGRETLVPKTDEAFCGMAETTVTVGMNEGDEERMEATITVVNKGARTCKLTGQPVVWFANNPSAPPIGAAAAPTGTPAEVQLAPGAKATAKLEVANAATKPGCTAVKADGVVVYLPHRGDQSQWKGLKSTACQEASIPLLTVHPFALA